MKKKIAIFSALFLVLIGSASVYANSLTNKVKGWEDKIYPNTYINGVDISGLNRESAILELRNYYSYMDNKKIIVRNADKTYSTDYAKLKVHYNIDEIVQKAFEEKRREGFWEKLKLLKSNTERRYELNLQYDPQAIKDFIGSLEKEINTPYQNASISITGKKAIKITDERVGSILDSVQLGDKIKAVINNERTEITEITADVKKEAPPVTAEKLSQVNAVVSSFSTYYGGSSSGRAYNVELAVKKLNGVLLMPGDVFSFNAVVGKRTPETGFKDAPVIINNKLVDGLGGGVCQVSTTLYNSIIRCGIRSVQRTNHTLVTAYVQPGFDATVSDDIDYKFKNTLNYPMYIQGYTSNGSIIFDIYSNVSVKDTKYDIVNEVYEKTEAQTNYVDEPTLPKGTTEKVQSAIPGYKVKVFLIKLENGKEVSRVQISNDTYQKVDGLIKVGTKN